MGQNGVTPPSGKLNIAGVGVGGMGGGNLRAMQSENIVALCDVDSKYAKGTFDKYPKAQKYRDFRIMLDKHHKDIDAVLVATPDHSHAVIANMAMKMGKHVYVQKPLTYTVHEARVLTETAREMKVVTQMGNQGHSGEGIRLICEWIWAGAIGEVKEVHAWTNRPVWPAGVDADRPKETPPVPDTLDWDLWIGPAPMRPYHPAYLPAIWRGWCDFGTGSLGDMACHILDPVFWALKLKYPVSVEASCSTYYKGFFSKEVKTERFPRSSIVRYNFPEREGMPSVKVTWWDGGLMPERPQELEPGRQMGDSDGGVLFIGDKGKIMCGCYGKSPRLIPETKMKEFMPNRPVKTIARIPDTAHEQDWIRACKDPAKPACSNFDYAGPLTEMVLMGNLAIRNPNQHLLWDGEKMEVTNNATANELVRRVYREGWTL
ncbi:MAG: Gfo/Idh/MocA family oxidoreductase [Phycisphaerae bacterium]|nr:Gfo/Idh/MocA family oxidoreductase [Phycisphaerae bacterium]